MNSERVKPKIAAKELQMDVITLRELMKREKLPIGYAVKREGKSKWGFYIYRHLLDQEKERLGMHDGREIDIFRSPLINPYMRFNGNNGICYKE